MGHTSRSLVPVNAFAHSLFALPPPGWPSGRSVEIESISKQTPLSSASARPSRGTRGGRVRGDRRDTHRSGVRKADILSESGKSHS
ncbi:diguanylate cyclase [Burkholderia sp. AU16741]|nr:diguanylate cyclase [Burkholderia sp. AU16741]